MQDFGLNQQVQGMSMPEYMAHILEENENQKMELERVKLAKEVLKQIHNHSRLCIDSVKLTYKEKEIGLKEREMDLREKEFELRNKKIEPETKNESIPFAS